MSNGLMASLAFWQSKQKQDKNNESLVKAILGWLTQRNVVKSIAFETAMQELYSSNSANYMKATNETLDFLKWLRHFAAALNLGEE
jgi:CRISPR type III-B/RAMP module-associated protein Cmr5